MATKSILSYLLYSFKSKYWACRHVTLRSTFYLQYFSIRFTLLFTGSSSLPLHLHPLTYSMFSFINSQTVYQRLSGVLDCVLTLSALWLPCWSVFSSVKSGSRSFCFLTSLCRPSAEGADLQHALAQLH